MQRDHESPTSKVDMQDAIGKLIYQLYAEHNKEPITVYMYL